jgi:hypothetical protein
MAKAKSGCTTFMREPAVIEIRNGVAVIKYPIEGVERAMSVKNLQRSVERAQKALRLHASGEDTIIIDD